MCHGGEKEWDPAIRNLTRAAELDPENRKIVDALGWMQARAGRYDDSLATFMKVHDEPEAHFDWPGCSSISTKSTCASSTSERPSTRSRG